MHAFGGMWYFGFGKIFHLWFLAYYVTVKCHGTLHWTYTRLAVLLVMIGCTVIIIVLAIVRMARFSTVISNGPDFTQVASCWMLRELFTGNYFKQYSELQKAVGRNITIQCYMDGSSLICVSCVNQSAIIKVILEAAGTELATRVSNQTPAWEQSSVSH